MGPHQRIAASQPGGPHETLARGYYVLDFGGGPDWQKRVMRARLREAEPIELPILPYATAIIYRLVGGEHLWIPRLLSSLFWIVGALLLYLLTTRFRGDGQRSWRSRSTSSCPSPARRQHELSAGSFDGRASPRGHPRDRPPP